MANFKDTDKSDNPPIDDTSIKGVSEYASEVKRNPAILTQGMGKPAMPRPNAFQAMLSGLAGGLQQGRQLSPYALPLESMVSGAVGGYGGYQQAQEQSTKKATIRQLSPILASEHPEIADFTLEQFKIVDGLTIAKLKSQKIDPDIIESIDVPVVAEAFESKGVESTQAMILAKQSVGNRFSSLNIMSKPGTESVFNDTSIPFIREHLLAKKYSQEEIDRIAPTLMGQPKNSLNQFQTKARPPRAEFTYETKSNEYGIPTVYMGVDEISGRQTPLPIPSGVEITKGVVSLTQGKKSLDVMYDTFFKLKDTQKKALAITMAEGGVGDNNIVGDEAGFIQRMRGVIDKALLKPAFGGAEGQKLKALFNILEANIPKIARGLGHTGVLTELDVMKSFGVAPDITGTMVENTERRRLYNELLKSNVDTLVSQYTPYGAETIDTNKLYKRIGLTNEKPSGKSQTIDQMIDDVFK